MTGRSSRGFSAANAALLLVLSLAAGDAGAQWPLPLNEQGRPTLAPLLKTITPAVVNISVSARSRAAPNPLLEDPFFRRFFDFPRPPRSRPRQSAGSGVIIDAERGYVLTNHHVASGADKITVTLADRRRFEAELVGSDAGTDIALLRIEAEDLTAIEFGDSEELEVGDFVIAIGNPFGIGQTVTSGIVSALGRSGLNRGGYEDFIQTDASINPGNSGGALVDLGGKLVGINTAIVSPAGGNVGIGFAVPTAMAREIMEQLLEYGEVRRGRLGVIIQDITPALAKALSLDIDQGALVTEVEPGSAAERAGLQPGDVITDIDGRSVEDATGLRNIIGLMRLGTTVKVALLRKGEPHEIEATIGQTSRDLLAESRVVGNLKGAEFRDLDPSHPRYETVKGVLVARVEPGSAAARNGLRQGDIVLAVNRAAVSSVRELAEAVQASGAVIALNILRGGMRLYIVIQ